MRHLDQGTVEARAEVRQIPFSLICLKSRHPLVSSQRLQAWEVDLAAADTPSVNGLCIFYRLRGIYGACDGQKAPVAELTDDQTLRKPGLWEIEEFRRRTSNWQAIFELNPLRQDASLHHCNRCFRHEPLGQR